MELFWKAACVVLLTVIFGVTIEKQEKHISLVLSIMACCMIAAAALQYLSKVIIFLWKLNSELDCQSSIINLVLKISGVALISELCGLISSDAGNSSLAKTMEILGNAAILYLSLPLFQSFFTIIQELLGLA